MEPFDSHFVELWRQLNACGVRYILVGGVATNLQGYQRYTGDVDLYIEDTLENRKRLRQAYKMYSEMDIASFETIQFIPGWVNFPLNNGMRLDIMTTMKGVDAGFDECLQMADQHEIYGITVPVLHINHLIANKRAVNRPKDQLDVLYLEKLQKLRDDENSTAPKE